MTRGISQPAPSDLLEHVRDILVSRSSTAESQEAVRTLLGEGFPLAGLIRTVEEMGCSEQRLLISRAVGVSDRTFRRWLANPAKHLTYDQCVQALRSACAHAKAQAVFGSTKLSEQWLTKPAMGLDGQRPIDLLEDQDSFELLADFLGRLEYCVYQ
ncbi:DUF2384 domain-containing protein (plasmid) [Pseudomonas sp. BYT-5]|uniref:antitoxin Xre/MbcA/ParS toxin-binding domain-containing protein n=1 Tax=unclassified Pseudomonas TaxID=196821 RepID=UPI00201FC107|nr:MULTISPECIES: antitoxin Xre/MbcA/ParS toxin-binding domain-containing protein [unclassified Pseudomonas]URD45478.1 DUF2384 domain-containing protein [Pseudomonas sp. BYT-5]URL00697.1 DUF2384 domain-containing protein [Pseudomonas sp. BYT-1]